MFKDSKWK